MTKSLELSDRGLKSNYDYYVEGSMEKINNMQEQMRDGNL